jgi:hypothetical protein
MADHERKDLNRREFLRKAAITGAVAWAVPIIQSVSATPAQAGTVTCCHSLAGAGTAGCMEACTGSGCTGSQCNGPCSSLCPTGQGGCNPCSDARACRSACWVNCTFTPNAPGCS